MKIVTVVGARPQFIKEAAVARKLRRVYDEVLVHTGQHYDANMSDVFFDELAIPRPDYNLGISGSSHGKMTGLMMGAIEEVLLREKPDRLLVYGDTNSTLAGALAAVKLRIPVCHVESGSRLGTLTNPEEINRICTDHVSSLLLYCTESAAPHLKEEGLFDRSVLVGDPMYDAFVHFSQYAGREKLNEVHAPEKFYYLTFHREENCSVESVTAVLDAANSLDAPTVYPVHPRNRALVEEICERHGFRNVLRIPPVGYLTSLALTLGCEKVLTDSGGLQREAFFAEKQCVLLFHYVCWPETMVDNRNQLAKCDKEDILEKLSAPMKIDKSYRPFGDGDAASKIIAAMEHVTLK